MFGCFTVDGEPLEVRIDERRRRIDHVPTEEEKAKRRRGDYVYAPRCDYLDTGELRPTQTRYAIQDRHAGPKLRGMPNGHDGCTSRQRAIGEAQHGSLPDLDVVDLRNVTPTRRGSLPTSDGAA